MNASHPLVVPSGRDRQWIGIVAAYQWEIRPLLRNRKQVKRLNSKLYSLTLRGEPVVLAIAGAGAENAFQAARNLAGAFSLRGLATMGFAGALASGLKPGDVILGDRVFDETTRERFECQSDLLPVRFIRRGSLLSVAGVVTSSARKLQLGKDWGALAADMESAGVARAAALAGLPFCAIKAITDSAEQSLSIDFNRCQSDDGGLSSWAVVKQALTTLGGARDLWRLAQGSRQAAGTLAAALAQT